MSASLNFTYVLLRLPGFSLFSRSSHKNLSKEFFINKIDHQVKKEQNGNGTDYCFLDKSLCKRSEYIHVLCEACYCSNIIHICPFLSLKFAEAECIGCPCRKMNRSIALKTNQSFPLPRLSFDSIKQSCNLAKHPSSYNNPEYFLLGVSECNNGYRNTCGWYSILGALWEKNMLVIRIRIPEAVYLIALWMAYNVHTVFWSRCLDSESKCESFHSYHSTF